MTETTHRMGPTSMDEGHKMNCAIEEIAALQVEVEQLKSFISEMNDWEAYRDKEKMARLQTTIAGLEVQEADLREALTEIRDVADCSEGVEFYSMLASKALGGE